MAEEGEQHMHIKFSDQATLRLLSELDEGGGYVSQRSLAKRLGVALGLTNSLLKRAVRKGLIKVKNVPAKRYAYYVTPMGFSEKSRLVARYLNVQLSFFRQAREDFADGFREAHANGHPRILLFGAGELAEIAVLAGHDSKIDLCGIVQPGSNRATFAGLKVYNCMDAALAGEFDAIFITDMGDPQSVYEALASQVEGQRIYTIPSLYVCRNTAEVEK